MNKTIPLYKYDDALREIEYLASKSKVILDRLGDEYFGKYFADDPESHGWIIREFEKNGLLCDIAGDYLYELRKYIDNLLDKIEEESEAENDD